MSVTKKWRPIILKDWEVRAILERRKTQLMRPVNPPPPSDWAPRVGMFHPTKIRRDGEEYPGEAVFGASDESFGVACPFGRPGDRLWGRETWWQRPDDGVIVFDADGNMSFDKSSMAYRWGIGNIPCPNCDNGDLPKQGFKKRPSTHMPRWASRISLEIESIRVEQVKAISEEDAKAEGVEMGYAPYSFEHCRVPKPLGYMPMFARLWKERFGPDSWDDNDLVWVATFRLLEGSSNEWREVHAGATAEDQGRRAGALRGVEGLPVGDADDVVPGSHTQHNRTTRICTSG